MNYFRKLLSLESQVQIPTAWTETPAQSFPDHVALDKLLYFFICKMGIIYIYIYIYYIIVYNHRVIVQIKWENPDNGFNMVPIIL